MYLLLLLIILFYFLSFLRHNACNLVIVDDVQQFNLLYNKQETISSNYYFQINLAPNRFISSEPFDLRVLNSKDKKNVDEGCIFRFYFFENDNMIIREENAV